MAGRRNRGNRKRSIPARAPRASPRRLLDQARQILAEGDARKALDLIRQARDRDDSLTGLPLVSFCASIQRGRQLAAKGMEKEAATMRARADRHRESISLQSLSADDWVQHVRYLDGAGSLAAYADHLTTGQPLLQVERALADRLVIERCWEGLDVLDASHPLRRDAGAVMPGIDAMDAGGWARAADLLQGVPRRSPFAAWRLFCKAMVCYGAGDDEGLRRTLDRLPSGWPGLPRPAAPGYDAAAVVEVVDHLVPDRLPAFARALFGAARTKIVALTTPSRESNARSRT